MTDAAHLVHGLDAGRMPADWPALRLGELRAVFARYAEAGDPEAIAWHSPRPLSAAALVEAGGRRLFVKRQSLAVRDAATLTEEHRFMHHLRSHGFGVPDVLRNTAGGSATEHGGWVYEVHAHMPGTDLYRDLVSWSPLQNPGHARSAGAALARLHVASRGYRAPQRGTHLLVARDDLLRAPDPVAALGDQLRERPGLADALRMRPWRDDFADVLVPLHARVQPRVAARQRLWTHNDWHASNLAWNDAGASAGVRAAFDFGLASPTFALFDLATAIERNAIAWLQLERGPEAVHAATARALIEGYACVLPLSGPDRELLADLLPVVHIDFALSEMEYFHAVTRSPEHAETAYRVFLIGHAQWFGRAPAQALLDAVRGTD